MLDTGPNNLADDANEEYKFRGSMTMKGLKFLALVSGLAVCTSYLPQSCNAQATDKQAAHHDPDAPAEFSELSPHKERGVRLDELFDSFKSSKISAATSKPATITKEIASPTATKQKSAPPHLAAKATIAMHPKTGAHATTTKISASTQKSNDHNLASDPNVIAVSHQENSVALVTASLDHKGPLPKYKSGEHMVVNVQALTDCNVVVFDYDAKNTLTQLYPNQYEPDGKLRAGQSIQIGGQSCQYNLDVAGKGKEHIFVYSYPISEQPITMAMAQIPHTPFRSAEITPQQYARFVRESRVYDRSVSVKAKSGTEPVSQRNETPANKVELTFEIDK